MILFGESGLVAAGVQAKNGFTQEEQDWDVDDPHGHKKIISLQEIRKPSGNDCYISFGHGHRNREFSQW